MCEALGGRSSETQGCRHFALAHSTPTDSPGNPLSLRLRLSEEPEAGRGKCCRHLVEIFCNDNRTTCAYWHFFQMSLVQSLGPVRLFATPWTAARQASLSFTISRSLLKLMSIESVMPSNHLILNHPFLLLPSISHSIRVFSIESVLHIRWPKVLVLQLQHQSFQ